MTRPRFAVVADCRESYDDRALELAHAAVEAGWDARAVLLTTGSRTAQSVQADGLVVVRIGLDGTVMTPNAVRVRALDDRIAVLRARRIAMDRRGEARRSPRRLAVVAATRRAQQERRELVEGPAATGDPVAMAAAELDRLARSARDPLERLAPHVVFAAGPHALAVAATAGRTPVVYEPRPATTAVEPALRAACSVVLEGVGRRLSAVVDLVAEPVDGDDVPEGVRRVVVEDEPGTRAQWQGLLDLLLEHAPADTVAEPPSAPEGRSGPAVVLGIAPANFAGQGWAWGRAAEAHLPDVRAEVVGTTSALGFPADVSMTADEAASLAWQLQHAQRALGGWTHTLSESVRPVLGQLNGSVISGDMAALAHAGVAVAVVCHGTDIRRPRWHRSAYGFSPFTDDWDGLQALVERTTRNGSILRALTVPVFVSTPDLLDDVPFAQWLPVVVGEADLAGAPPVLERDVPVVLHLPSSPRFKGTDVVDAVGEQLAAEGLVEYRSLRDVPARDVPSLVREADVVVDHLVIGNYGVLACQAMAAGRVTVGHVHDRVRRRVPTAVPVLEAGPTSLEDVLRSVIKDPAAARAVAEQGPAFVRELHDGRASARVLASFLGR